MAFDHSNLFALSDNGSTSGRGPYDFFVLMLTMVILLNQLADPEYVVLPYTFFVLRGMKTVYVPFSDLPNIHKNDKNRLSDQFYKNQ